MVGIQLRFLKVPKSQNKQGPLDGDQDETRANLTIPGDQIMSPDRRKATKHTEIPN